ncbi:hypothetical protein NJ7G_3079 [Natrinema sp. J7-2]|nr:hypothetical protein NJ7G_3079 [Natrinema sp. J7-2]
MPEVLDGMHLKSFIYLSSFALSQPYSDEIPTRFPSRENRYEHVRKYK